MRKKKLIFTIIFSIMLLKVYSVTGQDSTKLHIIDYLIKVRDLNPTDNKQNYFNDIFILDLLTFKEFDNNEKGIFKFGATIDHAKKYLLLKNGKSYQILDLIKLDEALIAEISFLEKNKISSNETLKYIEATISLYQKNLKAIPWTE